MVSSSVPPLGPAFPPPQIAKIIKTRSTGDIAISWAVLYITGLSLTVSRLAIGWHGLAWHVTWHAAVMG